MDSCFGSRVEKCSGSGFGTWGTDGLADNLEEGFVASGLGLLILVKAWMSCSGAGLDVGEFWTGA